MKLLLRYTFLPLITGFIIFFATCLVSPSQVPDMPDDVPWDKLVHFGMFFFLSAVSLVDYYRMHKGNPAVFRSILWGFLVPVLYGGAIELLQKYFFPPRSAEWGDWIADILGSLTAVILIIIFFRKRRYDRKNISL
ncbi:MAG: VanZ family protein [Porphyromonadaceae bacterium]|nr:VanZ family protein [Porphyromonadaceae bacterium]